MPARSPAEAPAGWGTPALRRATLGLAVTQLVSWGVLFYGFAVAAPEVIRDTGWSASAVSGAFALGLLVAGLAAPAVARSLSHRDPRMVLAGGSALGAIGMVAFGSAQHLAVLFAAWAVIGLAMAATLYEPAIAVLVSLDPGRRHRTLAAVTVAGGLASTVFAPVVSSLVDHVGWRTAMVVLGVGGGAITAAVHLVVVPAAHTAAVPPQPASPQLLARSSVRTLRIALVFEQAATMAATTHLVALLVHRGLGLSTAGTVLGAMGLGKVAGRLLLLAPALRRTAPARLSSGCNAIQLVGLALPLVIVDEVGLLVAAVVVGAASGATTILRPLLVVDLVGAGPYAAVSGHLQRASTLARAAAPLAVGAGATAFGWTAAWLIPLVGFGIAAERFRRIGEVPSERDVHLSLA